MSHPKDQDGAPATDTDSEALGPDELDAVSGGALKKPTRKATGFTASDPDNGDSFHGSDFNEAKGAAWP